MGDVNVTQPEVDAALLPCPTPWCDHSDAPYVWQGSDDKYRVICATCQVEGPEMATETAAIAAWNTRAPEPATRTMSDVNVTQADTEQVLRDLVAALCDDDDEGLVTHCPQVEAAIAHITMLAEARAQTPEPATQQPRADVEAMAIVIEHSVITFGGVEQTKLGSKIAAALRTQAPASDELREKFVNAVWEALKADTNDLRKQQRILKAFDAALGAKS